MKDSQHASQRDRVHYQSPMQPCSSWHQKSTTDFTATCSRFTLPGTKGWEAILDQHQRQPSAADVTAGVSGSNFYQSESCSHFTDLMLRVEKKHLVLPCFTMLFHGRLVCHAIFMPSFAKPGLLHSQLEVPQRTWALWRFESEMFSSANDDHMGVTWVWLTGKDGKV